MTKENAEMEKGQSFFKASKFLKENLMNQLQNSNNIGFRINTLNADLP